MAWTDVYTQFEKIVNRNFGKGSNWERKIEREVDDLYRSHKGERDWDEAYRRWRQDQNAQDCGTLDAEFDPKKKYWSDRLHRYLFFKYKDTMGKYVFEDYVDVRFRLDENEAKKLKVKDANIPVSMDIREGMKIKNTKTGKEGKVYNNSGKVLRIKSENGSKTEFFTIEPSELKNWIVKDSSVKVEKFSFSSYTPEKERKFEKRLEELKKNRNVEILNVSSVNDPVDKNFVNKEIRYMIKDELPVKPYFDPMYKDIRRAIVKEAEKYLASKGCNNSTGKYDKAIFGVRSLLERTLLQPGTDKFNNAVHSEVDRLLKKYNLTKDADHTVLKSGNGYELGYTSNSRGEDIIYFAFPGESYRNPHMWLGKYDGAFGSNYKQAKKLAEDFIKMRAKDADMQKEYTYSIRIGGDLKRVKVKADNSDQALEKVKKEAIKFKMERVKTKWDNNKLSTRDLR